MLEPRLKRREARKKANDRACADASRKRLEEFEAQCECVQQGCEERFKASTFAFERMRAQKRLAMAPYHPAFDLERAIVWHPEPTKPPMYVEAVAPNPASGDLDKETLKHHIESLRAELQHARSQLTANTGRIGASLITAAVVVSLFASVLPEQLDAVAAGLLLGAFLPFLLIAYYSIHSPEEIEHSWIASGRDLKEQMLRWREKPFESLNDAPLGIESYEQWNRINAIRNEKFYHRFAEAMLPEGDWLVAEVDRLKTQLGDATQRLERARGRLHSVAGWLTVLVVYLIGATVAIQFL